MAHGLLCIDALGGVLRGLGGGEAGGQRDRVIRSRGPGQLLRGLLPVGGGDGVLHSVGGYSQLVEPREQLLLLLGEGGRGRGRRGGGGGGRRRGGGALAEVDRHDGRVQLGPVGEHGGGAVVVHVPCGVKLTI